MTTSNQSAGPAANTGRRWDLRRVFEPETVAIVGARDDSPMTANARGTLDSDATVFIVNSRDTTVWGRPTVPNLAAIDRPVDSILSLGGAERSVGLAEEAAEAGAGGLVLIAAGFEESGRDDLTARLLEASRRGGFPVVGPNGAGFISVPRRLDMTFLARFERRAGGVSAVVHSGGLLEAIAAAGHRSGGIGLNLLISAGNETTTDVCDYLDYLVDDADTKVILLVIESIERPDEFFASVVRAREADKPILAMKIGRTARTSAMAASHAGRMATDAWVYEMAFRQHGIPLARDINELVNRAQFLDQLPRSKWTEVRGLAVLTGSGGMAASTADVAHEEGLDVPDVPRLNEWIATLLPGQTVANPLDARGLTPRPVWEALFTEFGNAAEFDTYVYLGQFATWDIGAAARVDHMLDTSVAKDNTLIVSPFAGPPGQWLDHYRSQDIAIGNGVLETIQGMQTMAAHVRSRAALDGEQRVPLPPQSPPPGPYVSGEAGLMLSFEQSMQLLAGGGVPVAPYFVATSADELDDVPFEGPYVLKLADVAHRSDLGLVRVGITSAAMAPTFEELQAAARRHDLPARVAVQQTIKGHGEAFVGVRGQTGLGPMVMFGIGGVFVEVLGRIAGRLAPFGARTAHDLIADLDDLQVVDGLRGTPAWDRDQLAEILEATSRIAARTSGWVESIDINPLIVTASGLVAVDALTLVSTGISEGST